MTMNEALKTQALMEAFERLGAEARGGPPTALATVIAADTEKWGPIVKDLGLQGD